MFLHAYLHKVFRVSMSLFLTGQNRRPKSKRLQTKASVAAGMSRFVRNQRSIYELHRGYTLPFLRTELGWIRCGGTRATEGRRAVKTFRLGNQSSQGYDCSGARHAAGNKTETQKERRRRQRSVETVGF